jgi:hypothetical protein
MRRVEILRRKISRLRMTCRFLFGPMIFFARGRGGIETFGFARWLEAVVAEHSAHGAAGVA